MQTNPILKKLGYSEKDRVVIIHADDVGMCFSSTQAFIELVEKDCISSAATMVPCSWFPKVALYCQQVPNIDMGIHLTITSEWDQYRWRPIHVNEIDSGLIDDEGYFFQTAEDVQAYANVGAVETELDTQVRQAFSSGINITHLDSHMFAVLHPKLLDAYVQLAVRNKLPLFFPRLYADGLEQLGLDSNTALIVDVAIRYLEENEIPLVDHVAWMPLDDANDRLNQTKQALNQLQPGITHFIIHPAIDTPELRSITPDWKCRVADYRTFMSDEINRFIKAQGIQRIGYLDLKKLLS